MTAQAPFADLLDRLDARLSATGPQPVARAEADAQLAEAETVLEAWVKSKGKVPTSDTTEGFRLLALHRQGARGDASFNACRETCREIVYLRNVVNEYDGDMPEARRTLRLQSMVVKHLALFVGGKMHEAGLGDFCCSSRPLRQAESAGAGGSGRAEPARPTIQGD